MTIKTFETRKSWIWFDAYGDAVAEPSGDARMASRVGRYSSYARLLAEAAVGEAGGLLSLPWPPGTGSFNSFWRLYLEDRPLDDPPFDARGRLDPSGGAAAEAAWKNERRQKVEQWAKVAWRHLMPLRLAIRQHGGAGDGDGDGGHAGDGDGAPPWVEMADLPLQHLGLEAFLYPHGIGLVATVHLRGELGLEATVDRLRACCERAELTLVDGGQRQGRYKLSLLGPRLLDRLRAWAGAPSAAEHRSGPFSVTTVVNGEVLPEELTVEPDGPLHRALEGLCTGSADWRDTPAPALEEQRLETKRGPRSHLLLACGNGRVVWFPKAFEPVQVRQTRLGCYHRNLTLLSLQVESLLGLVQLGHHDLATRRAVRSGPLQDVVVLAAQELGRLYGRTAKTYRSASAPAQIDAAGRKAVVDAVRRDLSIGEPLFR